MFIRCLNFLLCTCTFITNKPAISMHRSYLFGTRCNSVLAIAGSASAKWKS